MRRAALCIALLLTLISAGCSQVLELDDYQPAQGGSLDACGGLPYADQKCGACRRDECCDEEAACARDEVCSLTQKCYGLCAPGDQGCFGKCNTSIPYDTRAERSLERCLANNCAAACEIGCARSMSPTRGACFQRQPDCCPNERAIHADAEAAAWADCQAQCHASPRSLLLDPDACGCLTAHPTAAALAATSTSCTAACITVEPDWSCLGNVQWPGNNDGPSVDFRSTLFDIQTYTPLPGSKISVCAAIDLTCSAPLAASAQTDAQGVFRFPSLQPGLAGVVGYVGYFQIENPAYPELTYFYNPPIRQSDFSATVATSLQTLGLVYSIANVIRKPKLATIGTALMDCNYFTAAAGIVLTAEPPAERVIYFRNGLPDPSATSSDASGQALVLNAPVGRVHLKATRMASGDRVGEVDVVTHVGGQASALFPPTP